MKRLFAIAAALFIATIAQAVDAPKGPKVLVSAKQGNVTFKHESHAAQKCEVCHGPGTPKAIGAMDKEKAHALCLECHKTGKKGPTKCTDCHVKK